MKYSLKNDYSEGAHPRILQALLESNMNQEPGYGYDRHSQATISYIREAVQDEQAKVHLISGGTQTNAIAIRAFLRPHEACIAAESGHIAVHEAGAIEATGHKVCTVKTPDGKLTPELIQGLVDLHQDEHMVLPRLVYISNPTELGTVYSKADLKALQNYCKSRNLILYCDGARLGTVLCQKRYDISLKDMYNLTDAFFIGGTKNGALLGEILVIRNDSLKPGTEYIIKQHGALLAKGRLMGVQFEELFKDGLYYTLAKHAMQAARILTLGFESYGYKFLVKPETNQIFPILENEFIKKLQDKYDFYVWEPVDENHSAVRLVTSWATPDNIVNEIIEELEKQRPGQYGRTADPHAPGVAMSGQ